MTTFLNRPAIVDKIATIIQGAGSEIILLVPYIRLSTTIYERIKEANDRGVEITILYREDKLHGDERQKLISLRNVNLLHHPEIHAKCYFNETDMVITSMNLYEYSEKHNREMGILISNDEFNQATEYREALVEVREVVKQAYIEKKSSRSEKEGFYSLLLRPQHERLFASCRLVNQCMDNKKFEAVENGGNGEIRCTQYFNNINVIVEPDFNAQINEQTGEFRINRVSLDFIWNEDKKNAVHKAFTSPITEHMFEGFKVYWNHHSNLLTIYRDKWKFPKWGTIDQRENILKFKEGVETVGTFVSKLERELR